MDDDGIFEVDLQFDSKGRTALNDVVPEADYSTKVCRAELERCSIPTDDNETADSIDPDLFKELLVDCEIADSGLMPRTFWLSANDNPRCTLEQLAHDIFAHHTASLSFDPKTSGAEWWVQIRPSPEKTGRYAMHGDPEDANEKQGVCFHWDKDEELRMICGGSTYVHPHWSTITYLTDIGAPTLILEGCRIGNLTGEWKDDDEVEKHVVVSWPEQWKHLSFDGRWLHAVPGDLGIRPASSEHRRFTFLVNIWLNHVPYDIKPFPSTMLDKLSGHEGAAKVHCKTRLKLSMREKVSSTIEPELCTAESSKKYVWPIGDPGNTVTVQLPENMDPAKTLLTTHRFCWPTPIKGIVLAKQQDSSMGKRRRVDNDSSIAISADET